MERFMNRMADTATDALFAAFLVLLVARWIVPLIVEIGREIVAVFKEK